MKFAHQCSQRDHQPEEKEKRRKLGMNIDGQIRLMVLVQACHLTHYILIISFCTVLWDGSGRVPLHLPAWITSGSFGVRLRAWWGCSLQCKLAPCVFKWMEGLSLTWQKLSAARPSTLVVAFGALPLDMVWKLLLSLWLGNCASKRSLFSWLHYSLGQDVLVSLRFGGAGRFLGSPPFTSFLLLELHALSNTFHLLGVVAGGGRGALCSWWVFWRWWRGYSL